MNTQGYGYQVIYTLTCTPFTPGCICALLDVAINSFLFYAFYHAQSQVTSHAFYDERFVGKCAGSMSLL